MVATTSSRTHWSETNWGIILTIAGSVTDASAYHGTADSRGWLWTNGSSVRFAEYDAKLGLFFEPGGLSIAKARFPESNGGPTTAAVGDDLETVVVVMDGNPAEVWWHDRLDVSQDALPIGVAGNDAKQVRTGGNIFAISNNGSSSVTLGVWTPAPTVVGTHTVGEKPVGIDVMALADGGSAVVCTAWQDATYTLMIVEANGAVTSKETQLIPGSCFAEYAVFVPGATTYIAFSCAANEKLTLVETSLDAGL